MKMAQFARFANNATNQILGVTGLQLENLQSMFSYPDAINVTNPKLVSGDVIHIDDGTPLYAKQAKVFIEPLQSGSGNPSPTNIRAISGWTGANVVRCGENVWDEEWELGTFNSSGNPIPSTSSIRCKNFIPVTPGETYRYVNVTGSSQSPWMFNAEKTFVSRYNGYITANSTFTIPEGIYYIKFALPGTYGATYKHDVSINYPATDMGYHTYKGDTFDITFPNGVGIVYGGTLDVVNGTLIVDKMLVSKPVSFIKTGSTFILTNCIRYSLANYCPGIRPLSRNDVICNMLPMIYDQSDRPHFYTTDIGQAIFTLPNDIDDATIIDLVYPIENPITYNIDPTNILLFDGVNNIYADCGSMELEYYRRESGDNPYV